MLPLPDNICAQVITLSSSKVNTGTLTPDSSSNSSHNDTSLAINFWLTTPGVSPRKRTSEALPKAVLFHSHLGSIWTIAIDPCFAQSSNTGVTFPLRQKDDTQSLTTNIKRRPLGSINSLGLRGVSFLAVAPTPRRICTCSFSFVTSPHTRTSRKMP